MPKPKNAGRYPLFDRSKLKLKPLAARKHDLDASAILELDNPRIPKPGRVFSLVARKMLKAKRNRRSIVFMLGGHVIRSGVQKYLMDLMRRGYVSCLAMNGSGMIHDFEFSLIGATTESVARYIKEGQFGLWKETGRLNDYINSAYKAGLGMGEAVGRAIYKSDFPHKEASLLACAYKLKIPVTVHVGVGYDIIHEHPNCSGAATGETSYRDFLYFSRILENLEGGVVLNFGSAVMAPEVFLKGLSMARNVSRAKGKEIRHFTAVVCDIYELPGNYKREPAKTDAAYYFRPRKTMLVRTVAEGGASFYVKGRHADTIPSLWKALSKAEERA